MTTENLPLFPRLFITMGKFCQFILAHFESRIHRLKTHLKTELTLAPLGEEVLSEPTMPQPSASSPPTQWVLAEKTEKDNQRHQMMVEVVFFPDEKNLNALTTEHLMNYTIDGEDPNLRITHYSPSHRIH